MNYRSTVIKLMLGSAVAAFSASAHAETAPAVEAGAAAEPAEADASADNGDTIVVTGTIVQSLRASTEAKREALNVVDVASADSVGRFPDESAAGALARLPGVAVQRDQGQARYIQVRGAPNRWTTVSIDGIPQTGTDEGGSSRSYRFDSVPAVLLSEMRVNKSLSADLTAEAIVANIDLRTYSPLDQKQGFSLHGDLGYGMMDLGDGEQRQGSISASWTNGNWGVVLGGSHYRREQTTDNREADYDATGVTLIDVRNYQLVRENNGLFGALEFSPAEGQKFFLRGIYTDFLDHEQRNQYSFDLDAAQVTGTRGLLEGDLVNVPVSGAFNDGHYANRNYIFTSGMDYEDGNGFGFNAALGFTRTENTTDLPMLRSTTSSGIGSPSIHYDRSEDARFPIVTIYDTVAGANGTFSRGPLADGFDQTSLSRTSAIALLMSQEVVSDAYTAKFDAWKEYGNLTIKAGGLATYRDIDGNLLNQRAVFPLYNSGININDYVTSKPWETDFPLGFTLNYVDNKAMGKDLQAALDAAGVSASDFLTPPSFFHQQESIVAGYTMGTLDLGDLQVVGGLRGEYYRLANKGTALIGTTQTPLSNTTDGFDLFPSLNLRFQATDQVVLRLAGQRGVSRPAYAAVRVGNTVSDVSRTISGGNPFLKPEYTWGVDASAEYYLPGNGLISVAGFYRWVDNVLYDSQKRVDSDLYNSDGIDRSAYMMTSAFNGSNGKLYGVEFNIESQFSFLPGPLDGFGVQANLTLLDGNFDALQPDGTIIKSEFQGMSKRVANASLFYEKYGLSARVAYQWRSESLDALGGYGSGEYRDGYENLDVTLRYQITNQFTVYADLANLTNETYVAYAGTPETPTEVERVGSRYMFGVRFDF